MATLSSAKDVAKAVTKLVRPAPQKVIPFNPKAMTAIKTIALLVTAGLIIVAVAAPGHRCIAMLIALAVCGVGTITGFLFGIPRSSAGEGSATADANGGATATTHVSTRPRNASLEQVADWLTKLMLGASLTQLNVIKAQTLHLAGAISACVDPANSSQSVGLVFGLGVIGFFSSCGFLGGYLSTRLLLARLLVEEEQNMDELVQRAAEQGKEEGRKQGEQETLDKTMQELNQQKLGDQEASTDQITDPNARRLVEAAKDWSPTQPVTVSADPQKGRFGGKSESNGRRLEAEVETLTDPQGELFQVTLKVRSTGAEKNNQPVKFFLHDTFNPDSVVILPVDGVATLEVISWGAFTVGAMTDGGATSLELDLAQVGNAPEKFKNR